jgi:hypothetical protein
MGDVAVGFEAPELDLSSPETESPDLETIGSESEMPDPGTGAAGAETETEAAKPFLAVENGKLSELAKKTIEELKLKNPQLAKAVQRALFAEDRLRRELPGGFKEVAQLREKIEQLGGDEGIQSLQSELDGWKDFDAKYTAGDPAVLQFLTETPEAEAAFLKIAPAVFEKFREVNSDGYSAYISQVFVSDMRENEIPMTIQLLGSLLGRAQAQLSEPDRVEAKRLYDALSSYVNRINEFSRKPVSAAPAASKAGADPRQAELDTRETNLRKQEWQGETERQHAAIFSAAWKRLAATVPQNQVAPLRKLYALHLQETLAAKKDFDTNMNRFFAAKQKDGFLRTHKSAFEAAVPLALRKAMAELGIGARKAPATAAAPGTPATAKPPAPGFIPVSQKPNMAEVDNVRTTPAMWQNKRAVLKNGKQVTWG